MNVDTGQFRAIQARADSLDAIRAEVRSLAELVKAAEADKAARLALEDFTAAFPPRSLRGARRMVDLGRELEQGGSARVTGRGRRARPRGERPGWLRVVDGGAR